MLIYMKKELSTSNLCGTVEKYKHLGKVREQGGGYQRSQSLSLVRV